MIHIAFQDPDLRKKTGPAQAVVQAIERLLDHDDPWVQEDDEAPNDSLNDRANDYLNRLAGWGWFEEELVGMVRTIAAS